MLIVVKNCQLVKNSVQNVGTKIENKPEISSSNNHIEELGMYNEPNGLNTMPRADETFDSIKKSGKGLIKGMGGFLNKTSVNEVKEKNPAVYL